MESAQFASALQGALSTQAAAFTAVMPQESVPTTFDLSGLPGGGGKPHRRGSLAD